ncbi:MAG: M28 family peptidase, partial [Verrucomicrobiales bacterium]|nr:M28 family peptidase [Verrucomicrobiales bacterium]
EYIRTALSRAGCEPYAGKSYDLPYSKSGYDFVNLVGFIPGKNRELPPLLIGAHYDSVIPHPCADDNGAAVAIALAVAEAMQPAHLERDLIVAIFDAEEPPYFNTPCMGSIRFYEDQIDDRGIHFAMIHDLVGHDISIPTSLIPGVNRIKILAEKDIPVPILKSGLFVTGCESNPDLPAIVASNEIPGIKVAATLNKYVGDMSDHGIFRKNGVPYLFFSCGRWAHYHSPTDTPDRLNYRKMALIAELSLKILTQIDNEALAGKPGKDHTLKYEIQSFKNLTGPLFPVLLRRLGLKKLETRQEIETLVYGMMSAGI